MWIHHDDIVIINEFRSIVRITTSRITRYENAIAHPNIHLCAIYLHQNAAIAMDDEQVNHLYVTNDHYNKKYKNDLYCTPSVVNVISL